MEGAREGRNREDKEGRDGREEGGEDIHGDNWSWSALP